MRKWLYLTQRAKIEKTKGTLFSSTFRVWESNVPLVFWFMAQGPKYWHSMTLQVIPFEVTYWKMGYLAAALPVVVQQKIFTWWFLYPKGMGLALLLINSKNVGILDPPNTRLKLKYSDVYHCGAHLKLKPFIPKSISKSNVHLCIYSKHQKSGRQCLTIPLIITI